MPKRNKTKTEWTEKDIEDFMSDFCGISDFDSTFDKAKEVYEMMIMKGYSERDASLYAEGYRGALLDILNQK